MKFRTGYEENYDSSRYGLTGFDQGLTHQSFKDECDINNILANYTRTGELGVDVPSHASYLDLSDVKDYQTSLNILAEAQSAFDALPAKVRARFNNNPEELLHFVHDEKHTAQDFYDAGLIDALPEPAKAE